MAGSRPGHDKGARRRRERGGGNTGFLPPKRDFPDRAYDVQRGNLLIVLLCGGDKGSQDRDIALALMLAKEV